MAKMNPELGNKVRTHLLTLGIETPMRELYEFNDRKSAIEQSMTEVLKALGMDLKDDSLEKTPHRIAKMFAHEIFYGLDYANFPDCMTVENKMKVDEVVLVKDILVRSVCEHHFQPFIGKAHVAYVPSNRVMGLSKFNRLVDFFCRRPQIQERLTEQLAATMSMVLGTFDVAVVIEAEHFCVKLRGVEDPGSSTVTSKMLGCFRSNEAARAELFSLIGK